MFNQIMRTEMTMKRTTKMISNQNSRVTALTNHALIIQAKRKS